MFKSKIDIQRTTTITFKRPKRCYICKKSINFEKYDSHFRECCLAEKNKADEQIKKIKLSSTPKPQRISIKQSIEKNPVIIKHSMRKQPKKQIVQRQQNLFRIKNVSKPELIKASNLDKIKDKQKIQYKQKDFKKSQKEVGLKKQISPEIKKISETKPQDKIYKTNSIIDSPALQSDVTNPESIISPFQKQPRESSQLNLNNDSHSVSDLIRTDRRLDNDPVAPNQTFRNLHEEVQRQDVRPQENPIRPISQGQTGTSAFRGMIIMTSEIITFIHRIRLENDPTLAMMIEQLNAVNGVISQIQQLQRVGDDLGYTIESIFGERIRSLQEVILTQVSMAVMRSLDGGLSIQFRVFLQRNPQLRKGFTPSEIEQKFNEFEQQGSSQCSICLLETTKKEKIINLQCNHSFHAECIKKWLENSKNCPMCRHQQI